MLELGRVSRSQRRANWATGRVPSRLLAHHYGVAAPTARHLRTDKLGAPLQVVAALLADPLNPQAGDQLAALLASYEERFLSCAEREAVSRLLYLREIEEHRAEAEQNRATVVLCPDRDHAYLRHAGVLTEMSVLETVLGNVGA